MPRTKYTCNSVTVVAIGRYKLLAKHGMLLNTFGPHLLASDPDILLKYFAGITSDNSENKFDGYLLSCEDPELDECSYLQIRISMTMHEVI